MQKTVVVNRTKSLKEALDATNRKVEIDDCVFNDIYTPKNIGDEELEIYFFRTEKQLDVSELLKEYEQRGLTPVDPYALAALYDTELNPDEKLSGATFWLTKEQENYALFFTQFFGTKIVTLVVDVFHLSGYWWGGIKK